MTSPRSSLATVREALEYVLACVDRGKLTVHPDVRPMQRVEAALAALDSLDGHVSRLAAVAEAAEKLDAEWDMRADVAWTGGAVQRLHDALASLREAATE